MIDYAHQGFGLDQYRFARQLFVSVSKRNDTAKTKMTEVYLYATAAGFWVPPGSNPRHLDLRHQTYRSANKPCFNFQRLWEVRSLAGVQNIGATFNVLTLGFKVYGLGFNWHPQGSARALCSPGEWFQFPRRLETANKTI